MAKSRIGEHRSLAAHVRDCTIYRKRTEAKLEDISRRIDLNSRQRVQMNDENRQVMAEEFKVVKEDIAAIKKRDIDEEVIRRKWISRAKDAAIGGLFSGLCIAVWHIISKGVMP